MGRNLPPEDQTRSIFEDTLDAFSAPDDSLAELAEKNNIEVRDFVILSFVCDQHELAVDQLCRALGLGRDNVLTSLKRLQSAGFVLYQQVAETAEASDLVSPTDTGIKATESMVTGK